MIYCDRLTFRVFIRLIWKRLSNLTTNDLNNVQVLDELPDGIFDRLLRIIMRLLRFDIKEADFFAGNLSTDDGESFANFASRKASYITLDVAKEIIQNSQFLLNLQANWPNEVLRLNLSRILWGPIKHWMMKVLVTNALAREAGYNNAVLLIRRPVEFNPDLMDSFCDNVDVQVYSPGFISLIKIRTYLLLWIFKWRIDVFRWRFVDLIKTHINHRDSSIDPEIDLPGILVMQDDDLSSDRSYRTQPHWLFENDEHPPFKTYILEDNRVNRMTLDFTQMRNQGVSTVSLKEVMRTKQGPELPIQSHLRRDLWKCMLRSLLPSTSDEILAVNRFGSLFFLAIHLTSYCNKKQIKAFMTNVTYYQEPEAMQLIAPALGIRTVSYQYSNIGAAAPILLTTSDVMLTFSPLFHERWISKGVRPGSFIDIGYLYDSSFEVVRSRALERREKLKDMGAKFVICYFNESVHDYKYGWISVEDYCEELRALFRLVLDDSSLGLVVKSQHVKHSPVVMAGISDLRDAAVDTGRYCELVYGVHRNMVFPAEAALSADIAIGQTLGSTASLEAAVAGVRTVMVDSSRTRTDNDSLFQQANIVYPSIQQAIDAILDFRNAVPDSQDLGDWTPIINHFDPFRDGQSARRMRRFLHQIVTEEHGVN